MAYNTLIVGLGNPGRSYHRTRHNIGFQVVDTIAEDASWSESSGALVAEKIIDEHSVLLAKPQQYMNRSGLSVTKLARYYRIPAAHIIVVHDEIDLPFGKIKLSFDRGAGGHRGVTSIIEALGTKAFMRVRVGVSPEAGKPKKGDPVTRFVLGLFGGEEKEKVAHVVATAKKAITSLITEGREKAMGQYN